MGRGTVILRVCQCSAVIPTNVTVQLINRGSGVFQLLECMLQESSRFPEFDEI
jgi:hypothetical protein